MRTDDACRGQASNIVLFWFWLCNEWEKVHFEKLHTDSDWVSCGLEEDRSTKDEPRQFCCQWQQLGEESCLIPLMVRVWCESQTQSKVLLTLTSGQTPFSISHVRVAERGVELVRLKSLDTFTREQWKETIKTAFPHYRRFFKHRFSWWKLQRTASMMGLVRDGKTSNKEGDMSRS